MTYYDEHGETIGEGVAGAVAEFTIDVLRTGSAWAGYKAYKNHREAGDGFADAAWLGAITARRWFTMGFLFLGWLVWSAINMWGWFFVHYLASDWVRTNPENAYLLSSKMTAELIFYGIVGVLVFGIQYCRILIGGLHRQTWLFQVFRLPYMATLWIPSFYLYIALFILPFTWGMV